MKIQLFKRELIARDHNGSTEPYLERLRIVETPWFGIYLHRFLDGDEFCLHDHPWWFVTCILVGGYWETVGRVRTLNDHGEYKWLITPKKWHGVGSILFRRGSHAHRVELDPSKPKPVTLVIRGPRGRAWGFFTSTGWIPWQRYSYSEHCS